MTGQQETKNTLEQASLMRAETAVFTNVAEQLLAGDGLMSSRLCLQTYLHFSWVGRSSVAGAVVHAPSRAGQGCTKLKHGKAGGSIWPAAQQKTWLPLSPLLLHTSKTFPARNGTAVQQ